MVDFQLQSWELVMKIWNYKMWLDHTNETTSREMKKNEESLRHPNISSLMSNKLRWSSNLYQRAENTWWWTWHIMSIKTFDDIVCHLELEVERLMVVRLNEQAYVVESSYAKLSYISVIENSLRRMRDLMML